jgi:hypothetical protein
VKRPTSSLWVVSAAILSACATVASIGLLHSSATGEKKSDGREQYVARMRGGLSEVEFVAPNSPPGAARAEVESLARVIRKRSGADLSQATKERLAALEELTLRGGARPITASEFAAVLTQSLVERVGGLSDDEVARAIESARGFNAPDLPEEFGRGRSNVRIRESWGGPKVSDALTAQVRDFRDQAASGDAAFKLLTSGFINREVETRAQLLQEALPNQFKRKSGALTGASNLSLTPVQAILVAYSVISDDYLLDSEANLRKYMREIRDFRAKRAGRFPDPEGYFAYGTNGYLHSSPLDLFMDEQTVGRMLQLTEERSAR